MAIKYNMIKSRVLKVFYTKELQMKTPNRIDLVVMWWQGKEHPCLEYRRFYYLKKLDDWIASKTVGIQTEQLNIILENIEEIKELLAIRLDPETGEEIGEDSENI